jgi:hypothetical protein
MFQDVKVLPRITDGKTGNASKPPSGSQQITIRNRILKLVSIAQRQDRQAGRLPDSELADLRTVAQKAAADQSNRRVMIFLPSSVQVFRFLHTGALDEVMAVSEPEFVVPPAGSKYKITIPVDVGDHPLHDLNVDRARYRAWETLFQVSCQALGKVSTSFRLRHEMQERARKNRPTGLRETLEKLTNRLKAAPGVFQLYKRATIRKLGVEPEMARLIAKIKPRFLLLPSSLYDPFTNDAIVTGHALGVPTVVLQTGWDNPSSKGSIAQQPDHFGVWSEQSLRHVRDMQFCEEERLFVIGSPYYETYVRRAPVENKEARKRFGMPAEGPVVLLGGSFRQFDEVALLKRLEAAIDVGELPKMTLFYRPHPGRQLREELNFFDTSWKYTMLDPEIEEVYRTNQEGKKAFQHTYNLKRVADLLSAVDVTISPLSSISLESLLMGTPVLGICYNDGRNAWGPNVTAQMEHYKDMERVPVVRMCRNADDIIDDLRKMLKLARDPESANMAREGARYFVDNGSRPYGQQLADFVTSRFFGA